MSEKRRLRLPPPSDPPEERYVAPFGRHQDPCLKCSHSWHGLICRVGACMCQSSFEEEK